MASASATSDPSDRPLASGTRVYDRDQLLDTDSEPSLAVVVEYATEPAAEKELRGGDGKHVADVNEDYPADDEVVEIVFVDRLEQTVGDRWKDWVEGPDEIGERLREFCVKWSIPRDDLLYSYPESRLVPKRDQEVSR